jgi:hypothetical protein
MTGLFDEFLDPNSPWSNACFDDKFRDDYSYNDYSFSSALEFPDNNFLSLDPSPEVPAFQVCHRRSGSANDTMFDLPKPNHRRTGSANDSMFDRRQSSLPVPLLGNRNPNDADFYALCNSASVTFNPKELGLIPSDYWRDRNVTFGELVRDFFQKKNNTNTRFSHKLFNVLRLVEHQPNLAEFLGIEWVTDEVMKVNKLVFARLLGIRIIDGSLFHQQGNFPSHGFVELGVHNAKEVVGQEKMNDVDFESVRLLMHKEGTFVRGASGNVIESCKWIKSAKA